MTTNEPRRTARSPVDTLGTYARLVRVPNLFTAPPDVVLGAALAVGLGHEVAARSVAGVALASVLLYAAGTTLNDYADRAEDAEHRPERPIPSGEVAPRTALALGVALLVAGVAAATLAAGLRAGAVAAALAALIACYDGWLKGTSVGFLCMGAARGTNVLLGAAVALAPWALPAVEGSIPLVAALYVAAVTYMAEFETGEGRRGPVLVAGLGAALAAGWGAVTVALRSPTTAEAALAGLLLLGFAVWTGRALRDAYRDPAPETVGPAVGACVLGLVVLAAGLAAPTGVGWALVAVAFLAPALGLSRLVDVS